MLAIAASEAVADPARVEAPRLVSGPTPFSGGCGASARTAANREEEPHLVVDPRNPNALLAGWKQDDIEGPSFLANLSASTSDGGRTWRREPLPGLSRCSGGTDPRATDPWVAIGPDGRGYFASLTSDGGNPGLRNVAVNSSADAGRTWSRSLFIHRDTLPIEISDREAITADPFHPGRAYVVFTRFGGIDLSRTDDGGRSWTPPRAIDVTGGSVVDIGTELLVLSERRLVVAFKRFPLSQELQPAESDRAEAFAIRSSDGGATWSAPVRLGSFANTVPRDPDTGGRLLGSPDNISADVTPGGTAYVAWADRPTLGTTELRVVSSSDGERWTPPRAARRFAVPALTPTVAAGRNGQVALTWHDIRPDRRGDKELTARWWFAHSHNSGETWEEEALTRPFNLRSARAEFGSNIGIGDYFGLDDLPGGFGALLVQPAPAAQSGTTDVFFSRVRLGPDAGSSCLARRSPIGPRNIGRIRLGYSRRRLSGLAARPVRRTRRSYRYCVKGGRGRVNAVFSPRGRVLLAATTGRAHGNRRIRPGSGSRAARHAYPRRRKISRGLYRMNARSRRLVGIRRGQVRFFAVADPRLLRNTATLRRYLRQAGVSE